MQDTGSRRPTWAVATALFAIAFGALTVFVGGKTLFEVRKPTTSFHS